MCGGFLLLDMGKLEGSSADDGLAEGMRLGEWFVGG